MPHSDNFNNLLICNVVYCEIARIAIIAGCFRRNIRAGRVPQRNRDATVVPDGAGLLRFAQPTRSFCHGRKAAGRR